MPAPRCCIRRSPRTGISGYEFRRSTPRPPDTRKHTVLPVSIRLKSTEKTPTCVSMRAFLQPISARIYFGKTASHRKRARFVQSRGASPQAYWMSVKAAQRWGCAKRAFYGVCFLMPGGLTGVLFYETVEKACHCEPVLTLARQSVSKTYKSCAFRRFLPEKITDSHVASRREASALGVLLGMTGVRFIDTLKPAALCGGLLYSAAVGNAG